MREAYTNRYREREREKSSRQAEEAKPEGALVLLPPYLIRAGKGTPRTHFEDVSLIRLGDSIRKYGILEPLLVRITGEGRYELMAGERRLRAALLVGMPTVPCLCYRVGDNRAACIALAENLVREPLPLCDVAFAMGHLSSEKGVDTADVAAYLSLGEERVERLLLPCRLSRAENERLYEAGIRGEGLLAVASLSEPARRLAADAAVRESLSEKEITDLCRMLSGIHFPTEEDAEACVRLLRTERTSCTAQNTPCEKAEKTEPPESAGEKRSSQTPFLRGVLPGLAPFYNSLTRLEKLLEASGYAVSESITEKDGTSTVTLCITEKERAKDR